MSTDLDVTFDQIPAISMWAIPKKNSKKMGQKGLKLAFLGQK